MRPLIHNTGFSPLTRLLFFIGLCSLFCLAGCGSIRSSSLNPLADPIDYKVSVDDVPAVSKALSNELAIARKNLEDEQFQQPLKLAFSEKKIIERKLHSLGYYSEAVTFDLEEDRIHYRVTAGPQYTIDQVGLSGPPDVPLDNFGDVALKKGAPLVASDVLQARSQLRQWLVQTQCLDNNRVTYQVLLDNEKHSADVVYVVEQSPQLVFGDIAIEGLTTLDEHYLRQRLPFEEKECFKRGLLDRTRILLLQTGLIASVTIEEKPISKGRRDLVINVSERAHRSVTAGAGFETEEGFGVSAGWEHRNYFGRGEKLTADLHLAENAQRLSTNLTLPYRGRKDQTVAIYGEVAKEDFDAYQSEVGTAGVELSRQLTPRIRAMLGGELSFSQITEDGDTEEYALLSMPMGLELDYRNAQLDPTQGWMAAFSLRPYWDAYDTGTRFLRTAVTGSAYYTFEHLPARPTVAFRSGAGTINGVSRSDVPANIRFYAGGGGSVRGYGFQMLGPLDSDDEPDGGLSYYEMSLETRLRWGDSWGGVLFLDGGTAYEERRPTFDRSLRWGAGFGLRFYTSFAPIRMDIAFPLDKRPGIDDNFQIYVSIGQAF